MWDEARSVIRLLIVGGWSPARELLKQRLFCLCLSPVYFVPFISGHVLSARCLPHLRLRFSFAVILFLRWLLFEEFLGLGSLLQACIFIMRAASSGIK